MNNMSLTENASGASLGVTGDDDAVYTDTASMPAVPRSSLNEHYFPLAKEWPVIDKEIEQYLQGLEGRWALSQSHDWPRIHYGFHNKDLESDSEPSKLCITTPPDMWQWKKNHIENGVNLILEGRGLPAIKTKFIPYKDAHLLRNPPRLPVMPPEHMFRKWLRMGDGYGLLGELHSATIGGEIEMRQNKPNSGDKSFWLSNFHPFKDVVSERLQSMTEYYEIKPGIFPVTVPSFADRKYAKHKTNKTLQDLNQRLNEGHNEQQEGAVIYQMEKRLAEIESWSQPAGDLSQLGRYLTVKQPARLHAKNLKSIRKTPEIVRPQLGPWLTPKDKELKDTGPKDTDPPHVATTTSTTQSLAKESVLDWCLIKPLAGRSQLVNMLDDDVHHLEKLTKKRWTPDHTYVYYWSIKNLVKGEYVVKRGRTTGLTCGKLLEESEVSLGDPVKHHKVWTIDPVQGNTHDTLVFCGPGDSGSWVVDMDGNWIGLLNSGNVNGGQGYMLPVNKIIQEIEEKCQCTVVSPRSRNG